MNNYDKLYEVTRNMLNEALDRLNCYIDNYRVLFENSNITEQDLRNHRAYVKQHLRSMCAYDMLELTEALTLALQIEQM